ncbi:Lrp/AsnC family transcriptional regulator [Frigoribacterium faeni]|uniref:AsnC family transcriptional regulator n=2 Tax=Frigoribacterium faeni TaxID=145483 RepID=A0A7W3PHM0_9MICO|nr:Lrp/AsnC family transcriptional regulator [Frigoribacterium faeni]MBA8811784.1 DNA-binding Lrp family transcriptional regulator [Frigoribacterium faeni]GEK83270.1 AsnC family transcriptional regulator [Frigoribacterium faeni]
MRQILDVADQLDFQLINAVQISPRISWAQLAGILQVDASTLSRRWQKLVDDRVVWTAVYYHQLRSSPSDDALEIPRRTALVEVICHPGAREAVIETASARREIMSVHCTSGSRDLYLTVMEADLISIDRLVDQLGSTVEGIAATRTHHVRRFFQEGSSYRVGGLSTAQVGQIAETLPQNPRRAVPTQAYLDIIDALTDDVRRPVSDVQQRVGKSLASVSRGIDALLTAPWVGWRIDFAYNLLGWETSAMLWLSVSQAEMEKVAAALQLFPQLRMCASVTGEANLVASLWLRSLDELDDIENKLTRVFQGLRIVDRWVVPRVAKRAGHLFDGDGRWVSFVPPGLERRPAD